MTEAREGGMARADDLPHDIKEVRKRLAEVLGVLREVKDEVAACMRIIDRMTKAADATATAAEGER